MELPEGVKPQYAIFTADREFADYEINAYARSHNCLIAKRVKSTNDSFAIMEDGTKYKWVKPTDNSRGYKCSTGVIDLATCSLEFIRDWIPYICLYAEPEKNYVFVDSSNTRDSKPYDLHTLIDRLQKIEAILGNVENFGFSDMEYGWQRLTYLSVNAKEKEITFDTDC